MTTMPKNHAMLLQDELNKERAQNEALRGALDEARTLLADAAEPDENPMAADWDRAACALVRRITPLLLITTSPAKA